MSNKGKKIAKSRNLHGKQKAKSVKTKSWTLPTVLGLVLGLLGALGIIELRPQLSVEPKEPLATGQPLTAPFVVQNTGYFSFWVEDAFCGISEMKIGNVDITDSAYQRIDTKDRIVDRGEGLTVSCRFSPAAPSTAVISIFVDYKPWQSFPHKSFRKRFCFVGRHIDHWDWTPEPCDKANEAN